MTTSMLSERKIAHLCDSSRIRSQIRPLLATFHTSLRTFEYLVSHRIMAGTAEHDTALISDISRMAPGETSTLRACLEYLTSELRLQPSSHSYVSFWPLTNDRSVWSRAQKDWLVPRDLNSDPSEVYRAQRTVATFEIATSPPLCCTFRFLTQMILVSDETADQDQGYQTPLGISTTYRWADAVQLVLSNPGNRAILRNEIGVGSWTMRGGITHGVVLTTGWQGEAAMSVIRPGQAVGGVTNPGEAMFALCLEVREG